MTLSVIVPVYNRLPLLEKCLAAIYRQTLAPDEIILSDDGSEEDIVSFFRAQKQLSQVPLKLIRQQHQGFRASRVRNNGVSISRGELLVFLDQDIVVPPDYLKAIGDKLSKNRFLSGYPVRLTQEQSLGLDVSRLDMIIQADFLMPEQLAKIRRQFREDLAAYLLYRYLRLGGHGAKLRGGVCAVYRDDFNKVNGFDENFFDCGGEDDDLGRRLLMIGKTGYNFVKEQIPLHLFHEPNYQSQRWKRDHYSTQRKLRINRKNFRCEKGLDCLRSDVEIFTD
jgi:GT2 family glycosyltransferase